MQSKKAINKSQSIEGNNKEHSIKTINKKVFNKKQSIKCINKSIMKALISALI